MGDAVAVKGVAVGDVGVGIDRTPAVVGVALACGRGTVVGDSRAGDTRTGDVGIDGPGADRTDARVGLGEGRTSGGVGDAIAAETGRVAGVATLFVHPLSTRASSPAASAVPLVMPRAWQIGIRSGPRAGLGCFCQLERNTEVRTNVTVDSQPFLFPARPGPGRTALVLVPQPGSIPAIAWVGSSDGVQDSDAAGIVAAAGEQLSSLLPEHWAHLFTRPALRGHRLGRQPVAGRDWSTKFVTADFDSDGDRLRHRAIDEAAALELVTEIESVPGGALRIRHTVTNIGETVYLLEGLEIVVPVPQTHTEVLDFTGRHERERSPQRHDITDGLYLRENRHGKTGLEAPTMLVTGPGQFGFGHGQVVAVHVAWSGNSVLRLERDPLTPTTIGGGELLLPGEIGLAAGESYATPWVFVAAGTGLDDVAAAFHTWLRSRPAHPAEQPVTLNVWEAVYFRHDLEQLKELADRAARVGVQRYVLDDGWFGGRRHDSAGLGDWTVSPDVWPDGLGPLVDHVRGLGLEFGLWFEPEMVNPDSDLHRAHPDWVLSSGGREPLPERNQLVLDLSRDEVREHVFGQVDAVLTAYDIGYVKWDHNRDLLEAGSAATSGAPAVHRNTEGFLRLLDDLRAAHPSVDFETCASGGGRIDLDVLEHTQRAWTSDMTDALSRQAIQRWTAQLVAPEYLGAHVSAPTSHQTGRTLPLAFRAATALFGSFGFEWDLGEATEEELAEISDWVRRYLRFRTLLHSGRMFRADLVDPAVLVHGVVAVGGAQALVAHVQMDESASNRGVRVRVPGLIPDRLYTLRWEGPVDGGRVSRVDPVPPQGPTGGVQVSGAVLAGPGFWVPRRRPETILLVHVES